jgi:hypothetical protein
MSNQKNLKFIQKFPLARIAEMEKVVQPVNLVDRKQLSNKSLNENISGKSRYILSILAYHRYLSAKDWL